MLKISFMLFLFTYSVFALDPKVNDLCTYRFYSHGVYPGSIKMEVTEVSEKDFTILVTQKVGTISEVKKIKIDKNITIENYAEEMLKITFGYNKKKYEILKKEIIKNSEYQYYNNNYTVDKVKIDLEFDGKRYKIIYVFSKTIPVISLISFKIRRHIKAKKEYDVENRILLQDYGTKGNLKKL